MGGGDHRARAVIRAPNHLGELVLALPALDAAARRWPSPPLVQVVARLAPVLRMSGVEAEPLPLPGRHRVFRAAGQLRRHAPDAGVLLTPAFSAALIFALAGVRARRGTATDGRSWLLTDAVDRAPLLRGHRVREYLRLVGAGDGDRRAGRAPPSDDAALPRPRLRDLAGAREAWRALARRRGLASPGDRPVVGLVPGGTAPARRWPAERFGRLASRLAERGCAVRVFGAVGEEAVTRRVARAARGAADLGGDTGLEELAGGLAACDAVVADDTGAAHLAAALDRPLVVVWGSGDPRQTRPLGPSVRLAGRFGLPCHPCLEAECPRRGAGYVGDDARRECLRLVTVEEVEEAAVAALEGPSARSGPGPGAGPAEAGAEAARRSDDTEPGERHA